MKPTSIPSNIQYLFENADHVLSQEDFDLLMKKRNRAQNLNKNNGAIYPGLTRVAVVWLGKAYLEQTPVNKQAFDETIDRSEPILYQSQCGEFRDVAIMREKRAISGINEHCEHKPTGVSFFS